MAAFRSNDVDARMEIYGIEPDLFEGQSYLIDHDLVVHSLLDEQRIEVDEVGIDLSLPRKLEYLGRYYDICPTNRITF